MARRFLSAIKLLTGSTPPAGTAGDTFFDTDTKTIQIHDGTDWVNSAVQATDGAAGGRVFTGDITPTSPVAGDLWVDSSGFSAGANILRWRETAVGGETSLSGLDDLGTTLSYTPGYELVHINGVLQVRGQDYVATTGTTITGLTALVAGDVVDIIAHSNMVYGDYYTQAQADAKYALQTNFPAGAWTAYTPVWGSNGTQPALNNGTIDGSYCRFGNTVHVRIYMSLGSTSTVGTGARYSWTLPVNNKSLTTCNLIYLDSSANSYYIGIGRINTTNIDFVMNNFGPSGLTSAGLFGAASPVVPASGDFYILTATYEAA